MENLKAYVSEIFDAFSLYKILEPEAKPLEAQTPTILKTHLSDENPQDQSQPTQKPAISGSPPEEKSFEANENQKAASDGLNVEGEGKGKEGEEDDEEEGECGFCLFMKGGGCKETFISWEKCVEEGEKNNEDIVEKCFQVTTALKECMEAHQDYYAPILQAEKTLEEDVAKELEKEAAEKDASVAKEVVKESDEGLLQKREN